MAIATEDETDVSGISDRVQSYIDGVIDGSIVVGRMVRLAVERHVRDLETARDRGMWFDDIEAGLAIEFIEMLHHSKGEWAGKPIHLEPWQAFIVWTVFGWKKRADNTRRFNTAWVSVARKNGKSTLAAAVGHKLFMADGEPGAEVYTAATKRDQAKIVHEEAKRMARKSPCLRSAVQVLRDNLYCQVTESKYEPLGADEQTTDGLNIHGAIVDELHAHKTRGLWDVIETGTGSRRSPLTLAITTAGEAGDDESIYAETRGYSIKVLTGVVDDDSWFAYIAVIDEGDDWSDESCWPKANPNLGVSVKLDDLRRKAKKAKETPSAVANFRRKHINEDVTTKSPWISTEDGSPWHLCGGGDFYDAHGLTAEAIARFAGKPCYVGGDLSSLNDLTWLAFAFPTDGMVDVISFCWCPRENAIGRTRDKRVPYMAWADAGLLTLTEGTSVDYDLLRACLRTARDEWKWDIKQIAFDPNNARYLVTKLIEEDGFNGKNADDTPQVIEHLQTTTHMNDPLGATEKLILDGKLRHGGHRALRWCVSNVVILTDTGGRRRLDKRRAKEKIDGAVATVMAVGRALVAPEPKRSVYETSDIVFL